MNWSLAPTANGTGGDFECRISRSATYHNTGTPVFINETIALMYEAETTNWATVEVAPDWSTYPPLTYTFAATPPPFAGSAVLVGLADANWQVNEAGPIWAPTGSPLVMTTPRRAGAPARVCSASPLSRVPGPPSRKPWPRDPTRITSAPTSS